MTEESSESTKVASNPFLRAVMAVHNEMVGQRDGVLADLQIMASGAIGDPNLFDSVKVKLALLADLDIKIATIIKYFSDSVDGGAEQKGP